MVSKEIDKFEELKGLDRFGYSYVLKKGNAIITNEGGTDEFNYWPLEDWVHIAQLLYMDEDLKKSKWSILIPKFILKLQHRCLGCRFAFDDNDNLAIVHDLHLEEKKTSKISMTLGQMIFVGNIAIELIEKIFSKGKIPSDDDIDMEFAKK